MGDADAVGEHFPSSWKAGDAQAGEEAAGLCLCHVVFPEVTSCSRKVISLLRLAQPRKVSGSFKSTEARYSLRPPQLEKDYFVLRNMQGCKLLFSLKPMSPPPPCPTMHVHTFLGPV